MDEQKQIQKMVASLLKCLSKNPDRLVGYSALIHVLVNNANTENKLVWLKDLSQAWDFYKNQRDVATKEDKI